MEEWTDEFVQKAQTELMSVVEDWKYDFGADDNECPAMLLWMSFRLKPNLKLSQKTISRLCGDASLEK